MWALSLLTESSNSFWNVGFRLIRICYRGGACKHGDGAGMLALNLVNEYSASNWLCGFRLKLEFVIVAATAAMVIILVCGL